MAVFYNNNDDDDDNGKKIWGMMLQLFIPFLPSSST